MYRNTSWVSSRCSYRGSMNTDSCRGLVVSRVDKHLTTKLDHSQGTVSAPLQPLKRRTAIKQRDFPEEYIRYSLKQAGSGEALRDGYVSDSEV